MTEEQLAQLDRNLHRNAAEVVLELYRLRMILRTMASREPIPVLPGPNQQHHFGWNAAINYFVNAARLALYSDPDVWPFADDPPAVDGREMHIHSPLSLKGDPE